MRGLVWRLVAWVVTRRRVCHWIIKRASRHAYTHIGSADMSDVYMWRYWVFNPYGKDAAGEITPPRWDWLPSVRVHGIMRPDQDRDLHDHPWNARTIVLLGEYEEERETPEDTCFKDVPPGAGLRHVHYDEARLVFRRTRGYTGRLLFGQYHRITRVSVGGAWTLFFTWKKRGSWGFKVNGAKVPWREYLGIK